LKTLKISALARKIKDELIDLRTDRNAKTIQYQLWISGNAWFLQGSRARLTSRESYATHPLESKTESRNTHARAKTESKEKKTELGVKGWIKGKT
jgi:hypothetical protein